jgi:hypothetical protein
MKGKKKKINEGNKKQKQRKGRMKNGSWQTKPVKQKDSEYVNNRNTVPGCLPSFPSPSRSPPTFESLPYELEEAALRNDIVTIISDERQCKTSC